MTDSRPRSDRPVAADSQSEHATAAPGVSAGLYSQALEQQFALVRQLLSPRGPSLLQDPAGELLVRNDLARDTRWRARSIAGDVSHSSPFFWTAPIAHAIRQASEAMPAYTFTEEGFPCPLGFVWFEGPVPLGEAGGEGPQQLLQALSWRVGVSLDAPADGPKSALLNGWFLGGRGSGLVLRVRESVKMGWTLDREQQATQGSCWPGVRGDTLMQRARTKHWERSTFEDIVDRLQHARNWLATGADPGPLWVHNVRLERAFGDYDWRVVAAIRVTQRWGMFTAGPDSPHAFEQPTQFWNRLVSLDPELDTAAG